jgi:hypothetical protein
MAQGTGNFTDFLKKEKTRLKNTESKTVVSEIKRIGNIHSTKTLRDGQTKKSKTITE